MKYSNIVWLAWEKHRRTVELCNFAGIKPTLLISSMPRIIKHPYLIFRSFLVILKQRPETLIVQNPSIFLTFFACLLRNLFKYKLIVDAHNAGLFPDSKILSVFGFIYKYFQRKADLTVVTNKSLANIVNRNGGRPFELPDILPKPPRLNKAKLKGRYNLVYICTFGKDEPYREVLKASKIMPKDIAIYITGEFRKAPNRLIDASWEQIVLTGYLNEVKYWELLFSADLVMDLTSRENCLVCGAYEALSLGKPLILSNTATLREYFYKGAIFTANHSGEIKKNILLALKDNKKLSLEASSLKNEIDNSWQKSGHGFKTIIGKTI